MKRKPVAISAAEGATMQYLLCSKGLDPVDLY